MKETCPRVAKACGLLSLPILLLLVSVTDAGSATDWQTLSPGMELKFIPSHRGNAPENARITVLRIDAHLWELRAVGTSSTGENANHTGRESCEAQGLTAAINAGMFKTEGKTHVGSCAFANTLTTATRTTISPSPRSTRGTQILRLFTYSTSTRRK